MFYWLEFTKKKTLFEIKKILKLSIENKIIIFENALKKAKIINLENPILRSLNNQSQVVNEPTDLFYKGSKVLSQEIVDLKNLLIKLENEQFDYSIILQKPMTFPNNLESLPLNFALGLILGLFLSLLIIFLKNIFKQKYLT